MSCFSNAQQSSFLNKPTWTSLWNSDDEDFPVDPGFWEQYYTMKKNADGKIPRLPYQKIYDQQLQATDREQSLYNVQELGPGNFGGRTRAILLDYDNADHVFSAGVSGGLWYSADSGKNWNVVNDYLSSLAITSIAQDHFNHDFIYIGTGELSGNSAGIPGNGVYRSKDHGVTFEHLPSTDSSVFDYIPRVVTSPIDSNSLYVATGGGDLFRSSNAGDSMKEVFHSTHAINDLELTPSGEVWIGVNGLGIYYSPSGDSGTFNAITNGLPPPATFARIEMAIAPGDTSIMYAAFEKSGGGYYSGLQGVYKTTDGGISWVAIGNPDTDFGFYMSFPWYSMCMAVKPDDANFVVLGVGDMVYSVDGGSTWKVCNNIHADHHVLLFNPSNPTRLYQGGDGGITRFKTDQIWYTHTDLNNGYNTLQYYAGSFFPTGLSTYAGAQDNGTHYCESGSPEFNWIFGGDGAYNAINQQYPTIAYVSYQSGTIHRADDADYEFPTFYPIMFNMDDDGDGEIDDGAWFINPFEINLVNGDELLFVTLKKVWQTLDGGFTWQPIMNNTANGKSPYAVGISRDFSPTVYIGGDYALFYRVDDAYNAFPGDEVLLSSSVPASVTNDFISNITVHPADKSICYVSFSNFSDEPRLWKVTNGTTAAPTWTSISGDLPQGLPVNYIDVDPTRPDSFFLAGTDYGLYTSSDGGQHWVKDPTVPNVVVEQVKVRPADLRVFIFTHGRGMWTARLDTTNVGVNDPDKHTMTASVYPNPFQQTILIKCASEKVEATIRDVNGNIRFHSAAIHSDQAIELPSLSNGVYFLELKNGEGMLVKKIMKSD